MNIYDISKKCGVSIATISRVLNGSDKVSDKTRSKVMAVVNDTGFILNSRQKKKSQLNKTIGLLCTSISNPRIASLIEKICILLHNSGYDAICLYCSNDIHKKRDSMEYCIEKKMSAVIIIGINFLEYNPNDNKYIISAAEHIPVIMVNSGIEANGVWNIISDNTKSVSSICNNLIHNIDSHVLFLFGSMSSDNIEMLDIFKAVNQKSGIDVPPDYIKLCPDGFISAYSYVTDFLRSGKMINGIITTDDILAAGAYMAASEFGLSVPGDIVITGNGNTGVCKIIPAPYTTINSRDEDMSKTTVNTVLGILKNSQIATLTTIQSDLVKTTK